MDAKLVAWARAVKRLRGPRRRHLPVLWLFTDQRRLPDPLPAVARLPLGLAGVVLRHDGDPHRAALGRALARLCRARNLSLVVAGDTRLAAALGAGVHLRGGRWPSPLRPSPLRPSPAQPGPVRLRRRLVTSSAHGAVELRRARLAGAQLAFLSPVFPTRSHPGAATLGAARWTRLAVAAGLPVAALGGIDHVTLRRLPTKLCCGAGAIGAICGTDIAAAAAPAR